jgi:tRNA A-37 threonylcarbamoyl transferase component Bud32
VTEIVNAADPICTEVPSETPSLERGVRFGAYVLQECIGRGAMASVYRAEHELLGKPVALKVMERALLDNGDARQRFLREGQVAATVKHPNIVDITDVGTWEQTPYLVMELLEGEDLAAYLERHGCLSPEEVTELAVPIASALGAAHDRGVVHRDLKPSNIFLSRGPDGEINPKVLDFGISKRQSRILSTDFTSTPFDQLLGSPLYLPPEAVRGGRSLTERSDQYSFAVVLYECLTGQPPFHGETLLDVLNAISTGQYPAPSQLVSGVPDALERAILRAMSPDPEQRFEHVRDLGAALLESASVRTQFLWGRAFGKIQPTASERSRASRTASGLTSAGWRAVSRPVVLCAVPALLALGWASLRLISIAPRQESPEQVEMPLASHSAAVPRDEAAGPKVQPVELVHVLSEVPGLGSESAVVLEQHGAPLVAAPGRVTSKATDSSAIPPAPMGSLAGVAPAGSVPRREAAVPPNPRKLASDGPRDGERSARRGSGANAERSGGAELNSSARAPAARDEVQELFVPSFDDSSADRSLHSPEADSSGVNESPILD